jgi:nucleoside-diphosphate-sugar epimerase
MTERPKVLITGGAGLIGSIMVKNLSDEYEFTSFDLKQAEGIWQPIPGSKRTRNRR